MITQTKPKLVIVLFFVGLMSACSSKGTLKITQSKNVGIPTGNTVALLVEPDVENTRPIHQEVSTRIRDRLFGKLVSEAIFKSVVHVPEPADYRMNVKILGARQVSTGARIWLGVMAGSNNVSSAVQVHDQKTKQLITSFEVTGTSAAHPFSSEADLDDAIREAIDNIIQALR